MLVKLIDANPIAVRVEDQGKQYICSVKFEGGKKGTMLFASSFPFEINVEKNGETVTKNVSSAFFKLLLTDILRFYNTGKTSFDTKQTLAIIKIREAVIAGKDKLGEWITL